MGTNAFSVTICQAIESHYHKVLDDVNYKSLGIIFLPLGAWNLVHVGRGVLYSRALFASQGGLSKVTLQLLEAKLQQELGIMSPPCP